MDKIGNRDKILAEGFWSATERIGCQGVQFLVQIVLARLLLPEAFGLVAMIAVVIQVVELSINTGLF